MDERLLETSVARALEKEGIILLDLIVKNAAPDEKIEAVIFLKKGVGHDDCAKATEGIQKELERMGEDAGAFAITVSSPGLTRKFRTEREYALFLGAPVRVHLNAKGAAERETDVIVGINEGLTGDTLTVRTAKKKSVAIKKDAIKYVKLNY